MVAGLEAWGTRRSPPRTSLIHRFSLVRGPRFAQNSRKNVGVANRASEPDAHCLALWIDLDKINFGLLKGVNRDPYNDQATLTWQERGTG